MTGAESTSVYDACTILLDRYVAETPDSAGFAWDVRDLVMEAKILLVCEQLQSQISRNGRLEDISSLEDQMSDDLFSIDDLVEVVRQRLFEKKGYSNRLSKISSIFSQLSRADYDRTKIRPARIRNRVKRY